MVNFQQHPYPIDFVSLTDEADEKREKEMSPEVTIKRIVLPHNTISNRSVMQ